VVWVERGGVKALRVTDSGAPIDPAPLAVGSSIVLLPHISVAALGSTILVVWSDTEHVYGRRLGTDGAFRDPTPVIIGDGQNADVAANDIAFAVVWLFNGGVSARRMTP